MATATRTVNYYLGRSHRLHGYLLNPFASFRSICILRVGWHILTQSIRTHSWAGDSGQQCLLRCHLRLFIYDTEHKTLVPDVRMALEKGDSESDDD